MINQPEQSISVVVCTYNLRPSLAKLLESLNHQTYKNFELILVDNGPFGENKKHIDSLCSHYHYPIKIISLNQNSGPGVGRNFGVKHASYNAIAFTDDDCIPDANWLEVIKREIIESRKQIIAGNIYSKIPPLPPFIHAFFISNKVFITANAAFSKLWFEQIGGFDEYLNDWAEDFEIAEKSKLNGIDFDFIEDLHVNHPPVLKKYKITDHLMSYRFLKKYFYIIKYKKYQYKHYLLLQTTKKALLKIWLFIFFSLLPLPHFFINFSIPFLILMVHSTIKVIKVNKLIHTYPFNNSITLKNFVYYILTFWAIDLLNFAYITSFLIYANIFSTSYHPRKSDVK